jgi:hypothetical protein
MSTTPADPRRTRRWTLVKSSPSPSAGQPLRLFSQPFSTGQSFVLCTTLVQSIYWAVIALISFWGFVYNDLYKILLYGKKALYCIVEHVEKHFASWSYFQGHDAITAAGFLTFVLDLNQVALNHPLRVYAFHPFLLSSLASTRRKCANDYLPSPFLFSFSLPCLHRIFCDMCILEDSVHFSIASFNPNFIAS